ncbi:MAG: hypothetical protein H7222_06620 [Methylotenera sp.]|nr:hypothetical protein [Oligoflexia bacterium]
MKLKIHTDASLFLKELRPSPEARESGNSVLPGTLEQQANSPAPEKAYLAHVPSDSAAGTTHGG